MKGVVVAAALIFVFMLAIKDGYLFHHSRLNGGCTAVTRAGNTEYWRCPARIGSAPGT